MPVLHPSVCSAGLPRAFVAASARATMASTCPGPRLHCGSRRVRGSAKARLPTDRVGISDGRVGTRVRVSASRTFETSLGALESTLRPRLLHALHHRMPPVSQGRPRCERRPRRSRGVRCAWKRWGRCGRRRRPQFGAAGGTDWRLGNAESFGPSIGEPKVGRHSEAASPDGKPASTSNAPNATEQERDAGDGWTSRWPMADD